MTPAQSKAIVEADERGKSRLRFVQWLRDEASPEDAERYWLGQTIVHRDYVLQGRRQIEIDREKHYSNPLNMGRKYVGDMMKPLDKDTEVCIIDVIL